MEHLPGVLSVCAPCGVPLRSLLHPDPVAAQSCHRAWVPARNVMRTAAAPAANTGGSARWFQRDTLVARAPRNVSWHSLRDARKRSPDRSALVFTKLARSCGESLLPLRREQSREPDSSDGLPLRDRAPPVAARSTNSVVVGLCPSRGACDSLRTARDYQCASSGYCFTSPGRNRAAANMAREGQACPVLRCSRQSSSQRYDVSIDGRGGCPVALDSSARSLPADIRPRF